MNASLISESADTHTNNDTEIIHTTCYVAGKPVETGNVLKVRSPYDGRLVGTVQLANEKDTQQAIEKALAGGQKLTRYERYRYTGKSATIIDGKKRSICTDYQCRIRSCHS